jgi:DNA-binding response OmpR family regulator
MKENKNLRVGVLSNVHTQFQTNPPHAILVLDRDPFIRHFSAEVLTRHGYIVNAAEDGAAGWEELQANRYNLLITGQDLPKMTGIKLIGKLRAAGMVLPVVMVADRLPTRELARTPPLPVAAMLLKPISFDALLDTVNIVLCAANRFHEQIAARAGTVTHLLQESLNRCCAYSHWGLNA